MAKRLKTKQTPKRATLNSPSESEILSLVAKLGQKCHSIQNQEAEKCHYIRKIKYFTTENICRALDFNNFKLNIDVRTTLQLLDNKLAISPENNSMFGNEN